MNPLPLALAFLFLSLGSASAQAPQGLLESKGLTPQMLASIKRNYCGQLKESKRFLTDLNAMAAANNGKLRVGSHATYHVTVARKSTPTGAPLSRSEFDETWKISSKTADGFVVDIVRNGIERETQVWNPARGIFSARLDESDPPSCMQWKLFAEHYGKEKVTLNGTHFSALFRQQANLSNVTPRFTYATGVPFHLVSYREKVEFSKEIQETEKKLIDFSF